MSIPSLSSIFGCNNQAKAGKAAETKETVSSSPNTGPKPDKLTDTFKKSVHSQPAQTSQEYWDRYCEHYGARACRTGGGLPP